MMQTTEVFQWGKTKAVRIPESFPLNSSAVEIFRRGDEIVIREIPRNLSQAFELLTQLPEDFFEEGRMDTPPQECLRIESLKLENGVVQK